MSAPKFRATSKASYESLAGLIGAAAHIAPVRPPTLGAAKAKGKAIPKALATNKDGSLTVVGREISSADV
jgi:hypothetical protein